MPKNARRRSPIATGLMLAVAGVAILASTLTHAAAASPTVLLADNLAGSDATTGLTGITWPPYERNSTVEPSIADDPNNHLDVVAAYHSGRDPNGGSADIGYATSKDGGQTWVHGNVPGLTTAVDPNSPYNHASDPAVSFGPNGIVYINSLVINEDGSGNVSAAGLANSMSTDGGITWGPPVFLNTTNPTEVAEAGFFDDKNWITVDMSHATGHHFGRVYAVWDIQVAMLYAYCDPDRTGATVQGCDQLANWTPAAANNQGFYLMRGLTGIGAYPIVLQNGTLGVVFNDEGNAPVGISGAPNTVQFDIAEAPGAGAVVWPAPLTFGAQGTVAFIATDDDNNVRLQRAGPFMPIPSVDPVTGRIAVGWAGGAMRTDGVNDPEVAVSTDATGLTWGTPIRVDMAAPNGDYVDRYNTMLAYGDDGSLRVGYRQRQEAADQNAMSPIIDTYYQVSYDQGASWSTPLQVDTQNTNVGFCAFSRGGCFEGDYNELAPAGANTYLVREEAYASFPGEPPNNTNNTFNNDNGHINQHAWVAVVGPAPVTTPEAPLAVGLLLGGGGAVLAVVGVRRRRAGANNLV